MTTTTATPTSSAPTTSSAPATAPLPATTRAIVQDTYGSADVLRLEEVPVPEVGAREVLVEVQAAGVDRGTWHLLTGKPYLMRLMGFGLRAPKQRVPGLDLAGTVVAVGSDVTRFSVGDEVFGIGRGSFAHHAVAEEDKLAPKPPSLTFEQAAAVPVSGLTAIQGLQAGGIEAGQKVLVVGASGGVGTFAVQVAKASGAEVTGVCSTPKVELVRSLGADHVLDHTRDDFADGTRRYDLILDVGGNSSLPRLRRALEPKGTLVIVGGESRGVITGGFGRQLRATALSPFVSQRLTMLISKERHDELHELSELVEAGEVTPSIDSVLPLAEVPDALRRLEAGAVRGKLVIAVAGS